MSLSLQSLAAEHDTFTSHLRNRDAMTLAAQSLEGALRGLASRGLIVSWSIGHDPCEDVVTIYVTLPGQVRRRYALTRYELTLDGFEAILRLGHIIQEEVVEFARAREEAPPNLTLSSQLEGLRPEEFQRLWGQGFLASRQEDFLLRNYGGGEQRRRRASESDDKAKALFIAVAGQDAYDKLEATHTIQVVGSKGGRYFLYRRATYCVTRESDGVRLCAVVPGVPLWDHLLGIKLMIEHDEPRFLKTANVSGRRPLDEELAITGAHIRWGSELERRNGIGDLLGPGLGNIWDRLWGTQI